MFFLLFAFFLDFLLSGKLLLALNYGGLNTPLLFCKEHQIVTEDWELFFFLLRMEGSCNVFSFKTEYEIQRPQLNAKT